MHRTTTSGNNGAPAGALSGSGTGGPPGSAEEFDGFDPESLERALGDILSDRLGPPVQADPFRLAGGMWQIVTWLGAAAAVAHQPTPSDAATIVITSGFRSLRPPGVRRYRRVGASAEAAFAGTTIVATLFL